ncbi:MAG: tRNA uridine(34) 5-carboxymethylaminomethyl modification radical SAM/GNAT enzyme Elp3 [Candidatus Woesearchaeota archaeon]
MLKVSKEILKEIEKRNISTIKELDKLKSEIAHKYKLKKSPKLIHLLIAANKKQRERFSGLLTTKPVRTSSGVAPLALFAKPRKCPKQAKCIYCPGGPGSVFGNVPQSYTGNEPASRRAKRGLYDPYLQIFNRLEHYALLNQNFDKVEVIIMGGTFPSYPKKYKDKFVSEVYGAINDFSRLFFKKGEFEFDKFKGFFELPCELDDKERVKRVQQKILKIKKTKKLDLEKLRNETSKIRVISLLVETRPDLGKLEEGNELLSYGGTKVEIGVQSVYDRDLRFVKRGHKVKDSIESIRILKDLGFKINLHYMLGLCQDRKKDLEGIKKLFSDSDFRPDMIKIYPCLVMPGTELYRLWKKGKYKAISVEEVIKIIGEVKKIVPEYLRIQRIQRDIPSTVISGGPIMTNLRQVVKKYCSDPGIKCRCIRCREPMNKKVDWRSVKLLVKEYGASKGKEFFISYEDVKNDLILGFCRLRFPSQSLREEITDKSALVRELHVYGPAVEIGKSGKVQHKGLGNKLMKKAEEIAKKNGKDNMVVIAGVGVRRYFIEKLGYKKDGPYVSKRL